MDYSCLQLLSRKSKSISFTHMRQRLNMNGKFSMELQKHGVQRHWIGENLREMEAGDKRLTIFWYLWLLLGIIFNFDFWFLDLNELMKINFAICNPDLSPSVGAIRLLLPRPQLLQVSPQSLSPPGEKKRLQPVSWVLNYHHSDFSSFSCHSWLKPLVEDKSRAEQKDWLKPQKLLWVEKLSPHFPILSLPWLTWEAARFERTSRWFRTPWFEGIKSVFKVSRLPWSGWLVQCCWTGSFSLV